MSLRNHKRTALPVICLCSALIATAGAGCSSNTTVQPTSTTATTTDTTSTTTTGMGGTGGMGGDSGSGGGVATGGGGTGGSNPCTNEIPSDCDVVEMDSGTDTCPGKTYDLAYGGNEQYKLCLIGDTNNGSNLHTGITCGTDGSSGPELVYHFNIKESGSIIQKLRSRDNCELDPTMYARKDMTCTDEMSNYGCWDFFSKHEEFAFDTGPDIYHTFVDGRAGTSGTYLLEVILSKAKCGDGVINSSIGEECDDGNVADNDGCTKECKFELINLFDKCDGEPVVLNSGQTQVFQGNTAKYADDYKGEAIDNCAMAPPAVGGKDRVYEIIAGATGTVKATIGYDTSGLKTVCEEGGLIDPGCWDYVLYAVGPDQCDDMAGALGPQIACSNAALYGPEEVEFAVEEAKKYYIIIDGYLDYSKGYGSYNLRLTLTP